MAGEREVNNGVPPEANRIADMFIGKSVFITGGTGFLGKVLVEKLLRVCHQLDTIYLLVRVKKGKDPKQRLDEIFNSELFETIRKARPEAAKQLAAIPGDVMMPDLGISPADRALLHEKVNFVYHCAASIRFDEPLKKAVLLNTRGTKLALELASGMKHLDAFVHVSTAYCHLHESILREEVYPPPADPHKIIKCVEWMDESVVDSMTKKILNGAPNTYSYTKGLSEGLVAEKMSTMPVLLTRPSIVIPIWREPLPGWTDNINGPTGLLIGAGKGVIRTMWCDENRYADYMPVDIAVNALLLCTWNYVCNNEKEKRVYNLTSNTEFKVTWAEIIDLGRKIMERVPLNGVVWYPGGSMHNSRWVHLIHVFFLHTIPAYFLDAVIFLAGHKPLMLRIQDRINKGFEIFEYYANNQWDFCNDNMRSMRPMLSETEGNVFTIDGSDLDLEKYFECCIHATRVYILKEMPETLPAARRHIRRMYWVDLLFKLLLLVLLVYTITSYSETARTAVNSVGSTIFEVGTSAFSLAKSFVPPNLLK